MAIEQPLRERRHRFSALVLAAGLVFATPAARAERPLLEPGDSVAKGYALELGGIGHLGMSEFASTAGGIAPSASGFVLRDRNGLTARVIMGLLISAAGAMSAAGPKSIETETYRSGRYIVTETTTTYHTPEEQRQIMAASSAAVGDLFDMPVAEFELQVFSRDRFGFGDSHGYKLDMVFGANLGASAYYGMGLGWGNVDSIVDKDGQTYRLDHKYFGVPFRVGGGVGSVAWSLTWTWNLLAHGIDEDDRMPAQDSMGVWRAEVGHHPVTLDLRTSVLGRIYLQAGATLPYYKKLDIGYHGSAGFRF